MGFLQDIVSVLPTIAGVVAPLFNAKKNDYLRFGITEGQNVYFRKDENDEIWVYNPFKEPIALVFPDKNGIEGESIEIAETSHYPVTPMMVQRAAANVDNFQIVKGGVTCEETNLHSDGTVDATITASGKVDNVAQQTKIGTALSVRIDGKDLMVSVNPPYQLDGIASLEVSGDNDEPCRLFKNELNDGSTPTPVALGAAVSPLQMLFPGALDKFGTSKKLYVSVSARCSYPSNSLKKDKPYLGKKTTENDLDFLRTGRCLND